MLQDAVWILVGVVGAALAMFAFQVSKKGFTWASTKLSTWWSATDARFQGARVRRRRDQDQSWSLMRFIHFTAFRPTYGRDAVRSCSRQLLDAERGLSDDTRQTVSPTSSAISNPPVRSTAKPTGLPRA